MLRIHSFKIILKILYAWNNYMNLLIFSCKKKSLYELKQASYVWFDRFSQFLYIVTQLLLQLLIVSHRHRIKLLSPLYMDWTP